MKAVHVRNVPYSQLENIGIYHKKILTCICYFPCSAIHSIVSYLIIIF